MAWVFGDGFDLYVALADMANGYWDSAAGSITFVAGRFSGSQAFQPSSTGTAYTKSSGVNDAIHHIAFAFRQASAISGSSLGVNFQLTDGSTVQCSIVCRSDGAILLTSGGPTGTVLATYTGAFPLATTWYQFECEVVINNSTGSFKVRKNGNTTEDFTLGSLNTRSSANNYANKLTIGQQTTTQTVNVDDFFWKSDAASVPWLGDIRCYTRMPASDATAVFSRMPTTLFTQANPTAGGGSLTANNIRSAPVVAAMSGTVTSLAFNFSAGITGHAKMAIYDNTGAGGRSGALLASSVELTNPGAGLNTFTVTGGPTVIRGTTYYVALWSDVAITGTLSAGISSDILAVTYTTAFPSPLMFTGTALYFMGSAGMNVTPINAGCVNEPQQDATTSYVYSSNVNDADLYSISSIPSTPATVIATTTRIYGQKSDAGSRTVAAQIKSGSTTVASPTLALTTSGFQWAYRTDTTDPNTGSAWTPGAVNGVQIGPKVIF